MLETEKLMAITGIFPKGEHPSPTDEMAIPALADRWKSRAKRWLSAPDKDGYEVRPFTAPEPPTEKALQDKILKPIEGDEEERIRGAFSDPLMASEYLAGIQQARDYLDSKWPKNPIPGTVAQVFPLSTAELEDVWLLTRVLDDPEIIFDELEAESLTVPMVSAWKTCYPLLSVETLVMIDGLIIERAASKKYLTWQQQDLLHMLKGEPLDAPLAIAPDKPQAQAAKEAAP